MVESIFEAHILLLHENLEVRINFTICYEAELVNLGCLISDLRHEAEVHKVKQSQTPHKSIISRYRLYLLLQM
jgi:hypothetical protein